MNMRLVLSLTFAIAVLVSGAAYAFLGSSDHRVPTEFYKGHTHIDGLTLDAPQHSGGTDANGCHNASVPYHCH